MPAIQHRQTVPAVLLVTMSVIGAGCTDATTEPNTSAPLSPGTR